MFLAEYQLDHEVDIIEKRIKENQNDLDTLIYQYECNPDDSILNEIQLVEHNLDGLYDELVKLDFQYMTR